MTTTRTVTAGGSCGVGVIKRTYALDPIVLELLDILRLAKINGELQLHVEELANRVHITPCRSDYYLRSLHDVGAVTLQRNRTLGTLAAITEHGVELLQP
ncbi:protein of unknown function (plasmid) [Cupriavidus taiwanensis]|uniref:Transcriptional regulator n=1 Tax=Cupriavidus taiwanensis TaxID=164546 RepID=A0A375IMV9_9BURK|nr:hypothetical protein [Cupriavidus taiwanensis]SPK75974.1 protein of unknown function [Cupriavidus taiwanensis]